MTYDIIIIGAGASGLLAGKDLSAAGKKLLMLEAQDRVGGRAHTVAGGQFTMPVEAGAEFVHGKLPLSLSLLQEAGIAYTAMQGRSFTVKTGKILDEEDFGMDWDALMQKLSLLQDDMTLQDFLQRYLAGNENAELKEQVIRFAQGFDAADPAKVSMLSLKKEWMNDNEDDQYRMEGGYKKLMQWLADECKKQHAIIQLQKQVTSIDHTREEVEVSSAGGEKFYAKKVLLTIPLGLWQQQSIQFVPALPLKQEAALQMGFGNVIKVNVEFTEAFWQSNCGHLMPGAGFIFSDAVFPTWWTQNPAPVAQLSGWLAGPPSHAFDDAGEDKIRQQAIVSLCYIFKISEPALREKIKDMLITNWRNDPFARGGYSYETTASASAKKILAKPVNDKLFFAGEALYSGSHNGTVEAAFVSGRNAAKMM